MGVFANEVAGRLREGLDAVCPGFEWETERYVAGTPVDVAGEPRDPDADRFVAVELEWRRADPADNTAKLFRHLSEGALSGEVVVVQAFTRYYDLTSGGVSSKRKNAEFIGNVAADALDGLTYHAVTVDLDPPKRGGERPDGWRTAVDGTADRIAALLAPGT